MVAAYLSLSACNSIVRKDGDWFDVVGPGSGDFADDAAACKETARLGEENDLRLIGETRYAHIRRYNELISTCMISRGYRSRPYWKNWLPQ